MRRRDSSAAKRSLHDGLNRLVEVAVNTHVRRQSARGLGLLAFAGQHQDRLRVDLSGSLQVAQRVPYARDAGKFGIEAMGNFFEQARLGLAALAVSVLRMRTKENRVIAPADLAERLVHFLVDRVP